MDGILDIFSQIRWQDVVDILIVAVVIYQVILLVKGTRTLQMLAGLLVVIVALLVSRHLEFLTLNWIINSFLSSFILVLIILFQRDIRRALSNLGRGTIFSAGAEGTATLEEIVHTVATLSARKIGALIVLERSAGLAEYEEGGALLDSMVSRDLLLSIFQPPLPLHDGAVIIRGDRIRAARCLLPLSTNPELDPRLGTRHRAALGLSEESDAVCLVVSEERGGVSMAVGGKLLLGLHTISLRKQLYQLFEVGKARRAWPAWRR